MQESYILFHFKQLNSYFWTIFEEISHSEVGLREQEVGRE